MSKKKKRAKLTIEGQLEHYYRSDRHAERDEILWHAWCQNKRWLSQLLEITMSSFPTFSKHDESHAQTVLHNIEMILGENRIQELSASDCFMLLHTVYIHDIGMVITYEDRKEIVQNEKFIEMIKAMEDENDPVFQRAIKALQKEEYKYDNVENRDEQIKKLYADKLAVYYAMLHVIPTFRRTEHGDLSNQRLQKWTMETDKLGAGFSMAGIPQRIFILIAKCAGLHTDDDFKHVMDLPQEDNGYASDYLHPRFVAVLLQLGDILDMDNDRFHPLTKECIGMMPELSNQHYEKHQAIRRLYIKPDIISIEADCESQDALRLVRKECDILRDLLKEAGYNWSRICPKNFSGALPTIDSVKLYLKGSRIPEELVATQFRISQKKAFSILEGSNVYKEQYVFLREFLQNAIDASKIEYWNECMYIRGDNNIEEMRSMSPDKLEKILSTDIFPIEIKMEVMKRKENGEPDFISEEDIAQLRKGIKSDWEFGVAVSIKDLGTGIGKESIISIANVGDSRKKEYHNIKKMPEWLKPTAEFGIGLQSAFILTNMFKCYTFTRSNEKYEITFSTVKSNQYEGYINVQPIERFDPPNDTFGTRFEVFVPVQKKLNHELYPAAWDGKDYFDDDYETLRPLRHSAELLAQMALYLDSQIGVQIFPIRLNVVNNSCVEIPLNTTDKNKIRNLKYRLNGKEKDDDGAEKNILLEFEKDVADRIEKLFQKRNWYRKGKSWIYYYNDHKNVEEKNREIILEETENAIALFDGKEGHLYYWDNNLCTFCLIDMDNFLLLERVKEESRDKHCEKASKGVRLYYKGIELAERNLPGIGNELFQYIDIKGKLERGYINLSRKGLTEKGEEYFLKKIYYPLLSSIQKTLKVISKNHSEEMLIAIKEDLEEKANIMQALDSRIEELSRKERYDSEYEDRDIQKKEKVKQLTEMEQKIAMMYKENIITETMLAFFARKNNLDLITHIGGGEENKNKNTWSKVINQIRDELNTRKNTENSDHTLKSITEKYAAQKIKKSSDSLLERRNWYRWLDDSILFHIEHRPKVNLSKINEGGTSGICSFVDIFSENNQFMIVSKRDDKSAPWKQFVTPISTEDKEENIVYLMKKYFTLSKMSDEKIKLSDQICSMGENALSIAATYGINAYGENGNMSPGEYLQQELLRWLLSYIPTVALFMSPDGNTRVNIIHNQVFPFIFMNKATKKLIVRRIVSISKNYKIQRFSIPAWQELEYLSCKELPYSHYFVKRGYFSEESFTKIVFPFDGNELLDIADRIYSQETKERMNYLEELFEALDIRKRLILIIPDSEDRIEEMIRGVKEEEQQKCWSEAFHKFQEEYDKRDMRTKRVLDRVRVQYRNLISGMIGNTAEEAKDMEVLTRNKIQFYIEEWDDVYLYILLISIAIEYSIEVPKVALPIPKKELDRLCQIWRYVIDKRYLQSYVKLEEYEKEYCNMLELGQGKAFDKQERILGYIMNSRGGELSKDFFEACWKQYIKEIFEIFKSMSEEQFENLEKILPDKAGIELRMKAEKEGTRDGDK